MEDAMKPGEASTTFDWIIHALIAIVLVVVIVLAFTQSGTGQATTALFVFLLALLLVLRQGRLATVKLNREGFEATMAEVREATKGAEKATREVKEFMKITAAAVLGLVKRTGRDGGYSYDDKEKIRREYLANLREMGLSTEEIEEIDKKSGWHELVTVDYIGHILGGRYFRDVWWTDPEAWPEVLGLWNRLGPNLATPDELEAFLTKHHRLTDQGRELIKDYRYYLEHHEQRRPDVWAKRDEWHKWIGTADTSSRTDSTRNGNASPGPT
jgi:hypothetical protein